MDLNESWQNYITNGAQNFNAFLKAVIKRKGQVSLRASLFRFQIFWRNIYAKYILVPILNL